ncbi:uncharacterized protein LOC113227099 [Hyposmocoma kahamanoa]|uniref:uncharacterized protein LOC113227099 n=1 Tax=Hyposmocoma kahamanoa TaxID=1477025 RepID=UPI000E6D5C23|nr:uncharacterized protein LOC113227099 [Hyposmocoma kahamanoa]
MDHSTQFVFLILCSKCIAVNIKRIEVPSLVEVGVESVILDCEYNVSSVAPDSGLVMKWFFNGSSGLVYQWIPPLRPQVIGLLKGKVDMNFRISEEPLQAYRAVKILNPSTHLSGNYTCVVSTFMEEDRQTRSMLVYSSGKRFHFYQEKKYVFWVTLICVAEDLYPRPKIAILSQGKPLKQAETEITMDSWGMYSVTVTAVVHDDDVVHPWEEFVCTLTLPPANFTSNRTTVYYPGGLIYGYQAYVWVETRIVAYTIIMYSRNTIDSNLTVSCPPPPAKNGSKSSRGLVGPCPLIISDSLYDTRKECSRRSSVGSVEIVQGIDPRLSRHVTLLPKLELNSPNKLLDDYFIS